VNKPLGDLTTEQINSKSSHIDMCTTREMLEIINSEDMLVPIAVREVLDNVAQAVDAIVEAIRSGGRLFYIGAGTSGRLGVLDAAECPPTFGTDPMLVRAIIAGGNDALTRAVEGAEDSEELGRAAIAENNINGKDVVVGITASGSTPYVLAAIEEADRVGAKTIGISNNSQSQIKKIANIEITLLVGPEVIMGSTRMKSGTSQKLVLNMITTAVMVKLGKAYGNLMVDLQPTNIKLVNRAVRIVMHATGLNLQEAKKYLELSGMNPKVAIVMYKTQSDKDAALSLLSENMGFVTRAVNNAPSHNKSFYTKE
jgi:N-acetylmuramic acid 6-phosphate etherase